MLAEIEHHIDSIMMEAAEAKEVRHVAPAFRCSSMPFCPLVNLLLDTRTDSYSMDFYTTIGTAVHEVHQKWIPKTRFKDRVYGHWACKSCGQVHEGKKGRPILMPADCNDCGPSDFTYVEITVKYKGLEGHIDMITEIMPGKFIIEDWKTTDLGGKKRKYPGTWKNYYPSSKTYKVQIRTYASLLRRLWKMNVIATCLIFVDRGKVVQNKKDYHKVIWPWNEKKTEKHMIWVDAACANNEKLVELRGILEKSQGYSNRADRLLRHLVHNRPCTSEETYDKWMDAAFYGESSCPHKKACCKSDRASYDSILNALNPNDEPPW